MGCGGGGGGGQNKVRGRGKNSKINKRGGGEFILNLRVCENHFFREISEMYEFLSEIDWGHKLGQTCSMHRENHGLVIGVKLWRARCRVFYS